VQFVITHLLCVIGESISPSIRARLGKHRLLLCARRQISSREQQQQAKQASINDPDLQEPQQGCF
jgi:hypothetical protein